MRELPRDPDGISIGIERQFRDIVERSTDLILLLDHDLKPVYVSPSAKKLLGYEPEELVGKDIEFASSVIFPLSRDDFTTTFRVLISGEPTENLEMRTKKKDGTMILVSMSVVPILEDGVFTGAQVSIRDITAARKVETQLRESQERFKRFADNARDILYCMTLPDCRFEFVSSAATRLTGYSPEEFYADPGLIRRLIHPDSREVFSKRWDDIFENRTLPYFEYRITDRYGRDRWLNQRNVIITDEKGEPVALEGIVTDVSGQKEIENRLRRSEERFLAVTQNAGSWVWEIDPDGIYTYASPAVYSILGYWPDELVGKKHFSDLFDPAVGDKLKATAMDAISRCRVINDLVNCNLHRDGTRVLIKTNGVPVFDDSGTFTGYCGVDQDITREKEAEDKRIESDAKYRLLAENISDVIWAVDKDLHLTYVSPSVLELRGMTPEEALVEPGYEALIPDSLEKMRESCKKWIGMINRGERELKDNTIELVFRHKNGSTVWTEVMITPIRDRNQQFNGFIGVTRDITERKCAEVSLKESEEKFRTFVENANELVYALTPNDIFTYVSPNWTEFLGYEPDELVGKSAETIVHPDDYPRVHSFFNNIARTGVKNRIEGYRVCHKNGTWQWHTQSLSPVLDDKGKVFSLLGVCHDVTERKRTEEALRESEEKFRSFVENANDVVFSISPDGTFTYLSPKWSGLLGYEEGEGVGRSLYSFIHPDDRSDIQEFVTEAITKGIRKSGNTYRICLKDGSWQWHTQSISPVFDDKGSVVSLQGICHDITRRKQNEEALANANRQLSLLTGITRHDILNKITVILGHVGVAELECKDEEFADYLRRIKSATNDIRSQIGFTRVYEDLGVQEPLWVDLDTILPRENLPSGITVTSDLKGVSIFVDPMIERVFYNLLDNSVRHGERVTTIRASSHVEKGDLIVVWEDNGVGIPDTDKILIFERGFGKNTGLGMFLVREILSLTGISIHETGKPGTGARFDIRVPSGKFRI
nr:PAS domain S-box protein [uncultured Methanospirillum sp.]